MSRSPQRFALGLAVAIPLIVGIAFVVSPLGRWGARFVGLGVETQNAYRAFGQIEWTRADSMSTDPMKAAELASKPTC